ncbi:phosphatidylserine decarboxylase [Steroidobacter denitrificans]|uniref:Phosphatidylserine decarboxylase proenzyme n=1 Tax=Steroidobacter denitrificans TaxID=465721 RepID=A0A127FCU4_STEDE|nr:archaetidylserine decarboxylase [Steroidobacter denitrificans]AMN47500.1 phosphatidylserine decarboxylase [Steroidobacter denitrificans]
MTVDRAPGVGDRLFAILQYLLPKHLLSRLVYALARCERTLVKNTLLRLFLHSYRLDLNEAVQSDPFAYRSFNDFFTRALRPEARPIDDSPQSIVSPVDGTVSQYGRLDNERLLQAKGREYSLLELLGGDRRLLETYRDGSFACIYLAPYNYHRIHMPCEGTLRGNLYIPGDLFSVNAATTRAVPRLFARNERLICNFETSFGSMALILVGALFVGSIETVHAGEINPVPRLRKAPQPLQDGLGRTFGKGEELGRFNMGSTVFVLFQRGRVTWDRTLVSQSMMRLGRPIGRCTQA